MAVCGIATLDFCLPYKTYIITCIYTVDRGTWLAPAGATRPAQMAGKGDDGRQPRSMAGNATSEWPLARQASWPGGRATLTPRDADGAAAGSRVRRGPSPDPCRGSCRCTRAHRTVHGTHSATDSAVTSDVTSRVSCPLSCAPPPSPALYTVYRHVDRPDYTDYIYIETRVESRRERTGQRYSIPIRFPLTNNNMEERCVGTG
jgi:hypothetical protein